MSSSERYPKWFAQRYESFKQANASEKIRKPKPVARKCVACGKWLSATPGGLVVWNCERRGCEYVS